MKNQWLLKKQLKKLSLSISMNQESVKIRFLFSHSKICFGGLAIE
jgi:hypothetical protein